MTKWTAIIDYIKVVLNLPLTLREINRRIEELPDMQRKLTEIQIQLAEMNLKQVPQNQIEVLGLNSCIEQKFENQFLQLESLFSIYNSLPDLRLLPATRGWAGAPDFLAKILEIILKEKPRFVVEAGSGVSTVIIGLALKMNNCGTALSLEHEEGFLKISSQNIDINLLSDVCQVKLCPLTEHSSFEEVWKWYKTDELTFDKKIDVLVIDGPPRFTHYLARYPAIPLLHQHFSDRVLILLDDANREDELIAVQQWIKFLHKKQFSVSIEEYKNFEKGMMILEVCRLNSSS